MVNPADPGAGEPAGIRSVAATRSAKAAELRRVHSVVTSAQDAVSGSLWSGQSQVAFLSAMSSVTPDLLLLADALDAQASALQSYAGQVQQIKDQQAALTFQRAQAQSVLDAAQSKLNASHALDDRVVAQERATGNDVRTDGILRTRAHLSDRIDHQRSALRAVDAQWDDLVAWRRRVDSACAAALTGQRVLGRTSVFSGGAIRTHTPQQLLTMLAGLSVTDLKALLKAHPELAGELAKADPKVVASWWSAMNSADGSTSAAQSALIVGIPTIIGALNGVPALARVAANRLNAATELTRAESKLTIDQYVENTVEEVTGSVDKGRTDEIARLKAEIAYLREAVTGTVQLYLYDPSASRIIEMIGTPSPKTTHVITYVPGTFTSVNEFYGTVVQQVGNFLVDGRADSVVFVYKDGPFPGGNDNASAPNFLRIMEANDQAGAHAAGKTLAGFQAGMTQDPSLAGKPTVAIGHSWGLTDVTASEMAGSHYGQVISLSGAWMPQGWQAQQGTHYTDFSYNDILQSLQRDGLVGDGNTPRSNPAFVHGNYYQATGDQYIYVPGTSSWNEYNISNGIADHNLIASNDRANRSALDDIRGSIDAAK